jgi:hypothetical protein
MSDSKVLHIRKLAGEDGRPRVPSHDLEGRHTFRDLITGEVSPKPLAGIQIGSPDDRGTPPQVTGVSTQLVDQGQAEGWLTLVDAEPKVFAGGPATAPFAKTHTFVHAAKIVFHTVDGDVTYRVTRNPGKYVGDKLASSSVAGDPTAEVHSDYRLELEG